MKYNKNNKRTPHAGEYIQNFDGGHGNMTVRNYWKQASESIERLLRFYPSNIHPEFALNACEKKINESLFQCGRLAFCEKCDASCTVNVQMKETIKVS